MTGLDPVVHGDQPNSAIRPSERSKSGSVKPRVHLEQLDGPRNEEFHKKCHAADMVFLCMHVREPSYYKIEHVGFCKTTDSLISCDNMSMRTKWAAYTELCGPCKAAAVANGKFYSTITDYMTQWKRGEKAGELPKLNWDLGPRDSAITMWDMWLMVRNGSSATGIPIPTDDDMAPEMENNPTQVKSSLSNAAPRATFPADRTSGLQGEVAHAPKDAQATHAQAEAAHAQTQKTKGPIIRVLDPRTGTGWVKTTGTQLMAMATHSNAPIIKYGVDGATAPQAEVAQAPKDAQATHDQTQAQTKVKTLEPVTINSSSSDPKPEPTDDEALLKLRQEKTVQKVFNIIDHDNRHGITGQFDLKDHDAAIEARLWEKYRKTWMAMPSADNGGVEASGPAPPSNVKRSMDEALASKEKKQKRGGGGLQAMMPLEGEEGELVEKDDALEDGGVHLVDKFTEDWVDIVRAPGK